MEIREGREDWIKREDKGWEMREEVLATSVAAVRATLDSNLSAKICGAEVWRLDL
jgi:hypothetical protein